MTDHDALARRIAIDVMTGDGERAVRLDLVDDTGCTFGAWALTPLTELIAQHLREAMPTSGPCESGWLIERNREHWPEWAMFGEFGVEWTNDSTKACRFCRREDATQLAYGEDCDAITEHTWS